MKICFLLFCKSTQNSNAGNNLKYSRETHGNIIFSREKLKCRTELYHLKRFHTELLSACYVQLVLTGRVIIYTINQDLAKQIPLHVANILCWPRLSGFILNSPSLGRPVFFFFSERSS